MNHPTSYKRKVANKGFDRGPPVSQHGLTFLLHRVAASCEQGYVHV